MDMERCDPVPFFAALADPTRLRLVQILARQPQERPLCVNALAMRLGVSQPAVSQHLRVLRGLGIVRPTRCGTRVHYFLDDERFVEWRRLIIETLKMSGEMELPTLPTEGGPGHV